jgi:hypothetical protein
MDWSSHFTGVEVRELWERAEVFYYAFNSMVGTWNITKFGCVVFYLGIISHK